MNLRGLDIKWALAFVGTIALAVTTTLLTLALVDSGRDQATAEEGPTPTEQAVQSTAPTDDATTTPPPIPTATTTPQAAEPKPDRCSPGWVLYDYPDAGYSVCIPPDWVVIDNSGKGAEGLYINIFDPDLAPFAGQPRGGTVPGSVKMGIRVAPPSEPYDRSHLDDPTNCSTHTVEEISGKQVDVCPTYATDPQLLPRDRFAPGEDKGIGWVFPPINGATLIAGALFDSPVSAEDDSAAAEIVGSIRQ